MTMKKMAIAIGLLAALTGCASTKQPWNEYATEHQCKPTGATQIKTKMINNQMTLGAGDIGFGGTTMNIPTPIAQRIYQYECNNGVIWAASL